MSTVVVVGAGISGLAAAHALRTECDAAGRPVDVIVIEAGSAVGGKLRVSDIAGLPVDEGAESFLARAWEGRALVEACGLGNNLVHPVATRARLWAHGRLAPLPQRTLIGIPSSLASLRGVLRAPEIVRASLDRVMPGNGPGESDISVGEWVAHRLGSAVVDLLVDPLLGGVYAGRAQELSLQATMPMLPRDQRSAMAAVAAALPTGPPTNEPVFSSLSAGMGSLPAAVLKASGATLVSGRPVRRIEPRTDGWRVVHGATTDERVVDADAVVCATPPHAAARLLSNAAPLATRRLDDIESASMAIVTTAWRRDDAGTTAMSGYLVPAATRPRRAVKAVTFASAKWGHLDRDPDLVVVRCSIGRHREVVDLQRDDAELVELAAAELTAYAGFRGRPVASRVSRWGGALPQPAVGHLARIQTIRDDVARVGGIAVCGAAFEGVGIPACIRSGQKAAADVSAWLQRRTRALQ